MTDRANTNPSHHIAQINIGTLLAPADDPAIAEFMDNLERINALADAAEGFVWRLQTPDGDATGIQATPNPRQLVNMSVWESVETLREYVYRSDHVAFFRRRSEWFDNDAKQVALWWQRPGTVPRLDDAVRRLAFLDRHGSSPYAFGFARPEPPMTIEDRPLEDPQVQALIALLDAELTALAGNPCENHFGLTKEETSGENGRLVVAELDGQPVGCGAVRRIAPSVGEFKRMFVAESARGRKIGASIADHLEQVAVDLGLTELKLETSAKQPAAVSMYERMGFRRCEPWGEYVATADTSLCFSKELHPIG